MNNLKILTLFVLLLLWTGLLYSRTLQESALSNMNPEDQAFFLKLTEEKRDLNAVPENTMLHFFKIMNIDEKKAIDIIKYRKIHGEIENFDELLLIPVEPDIIESLKSYFYIESRRKSIEEILEGLEGDRLENIDYYSDFLIFPVNLNAAGQKDMASLPAMDEKKAAAIIEYRNEKPINELFDLTNAGLTPDDLLILSPFITIKPPVEKGLTLSLKAGILNTSSMEISNKITNENSEADEYFYRLILTASRLKIYCSIKTYTNITEFSHWDSSISNIRLSALWESPDFSIIAGQYQFSAGQGLLMGKRYAVSPSDIDKAPVKKLNRGLYPSLSFGYDSNYDNVWDFLNGAAASVSLSQFNIAGFYPEPKIAGFYSYFETGPSMEKTNQVDYGFSAESKIPLFDTMLGGAYISHQGADSVAHMNGGSVYYDSYLFDTVNLFGEYASYGGTAAEQGTILKIDRFTASILGYYLEANYSAPYRGIVLHDDADVKGIFAGCNYKFPVITVQFYSDFYSKITNSPLNQKHEIKLKSMFNFQNEFVNSLETELKSRYSILSEGDNLRSYFNNKFSLFHDKIRLNLKWQNLLDFTDEEMGNMGTIRFEIIPVRNFSFVFLWNSYRSYSYNSALFAIEEEIPAGITQIKSYYGIGNEVSFLIKFNISEGSLLLFNFSDDERTKAYRVQASEKSLAGSLELLF